MHSGEPDPIFPAPRRPRKGPGKLLRELPNVVRGLMVMLRRYTSRCGPGKPGLVGVGRLGG